MGWRGARGLGTTRATARRPARARPEPTARDSPRRTRASLRWCLCRHAPNSSPSRPGPNPSLHLDPRVSSAGSVGFGLRGPSVALVRCPFRTLAHEWTDGPASRRRTRRPPWEGSCRAASTAPSGSGRRAEAQNSAPRTPGSRGLGSRRARAACRAGRCAERSGPGPARGTTPRTGRPGCSSWREAGPRPGETRSRPCSGRR
jgi:hypothetical protein